MSQINREQLSIAAERAVLVTVQLPGRHFDPDDPLGELRALAETAGAEVVGELMQRLRRPTGRTYLGRGKARELAELVEVTEATLIVFDHDLSPAQVKALEEEARCKVVDRSELILDIFANRAATHAAKLQVEIAQLEYTYPRLRAMWSHLEQIVGGAPVGIGTRGPGEKQLEIDRRLVQRRLRQLRQELAEIRKRKAREVARRNRDHATVGLVGYTNAGKSTLFNRLTAGGAYAHEKLFATLSTRIERWDLGGGNAVLLSDTVGFIRDLPHHLVASFRSTLEETVAARALIIVVDGCDPAAEMQLDTVFRTLVEIGATRQPRIVVINKIDGFARPADLCVWLNRHPEAIGISAVEGDGLDELVERVRELMVGAEREVVIRLPLQASRQVAFLEQRTTVLGRRYDGETVEMTVRIGRRQVDQLLARGAVTTIAGEEPLSAVRRIWGEDGLEPPAPRVPPHDRLHPGCELSA